MALNRQLESMQDDNASKFGDFPWSQQGSKIKRNMDSESDSGQSSPKRMAIELTSDEEGESPVTVSAPSSVIVPEDSGEGQPISHPAVEYLNNSATVQVFEVPQESDGNTKNRIQDIETETINGFPAYHLQKNVPFLNETLQLCMGIELDQRYICSQVPMNIHESALFIVDFQCVRHHDVVARDRGSFGRQSSPTRHVAIKVLPDGTIEDIKTIKIMGTDSLEPGYDFYKIRRHYTWHKFIPGLSRIITRLEYKNVLFRYGVVQFKLAEEDKSFASNFKPQQTTKEKVHVQRGTPKSSLERHSQAEASSPNTTTSPRTLRQAPSTNAPNSAQFSSGPRDSLENHSASKSTAEPQATQPQNDAASCKSEIFNILQNADKPRPQLSNVPDFSKLLSLLKCEDFLSDVSFSSVVIDNTRELNPRTFAMGELQRHWLKTYCAGQNPKSVVSISTRYKLGNHYLTTLTCSLPIFVLRDDPSKHPTVLLALMTSLTNDSEDYQYLASNLRRQGIKGMVYGTDGNQNLDEALERTFPAQEYFLNAPSLEKTIHLCCFEKVREYITSKLEELHVKQGERKTILRHIFGSESERTTSDCLVDQKSEGKFRDVLAVVEKNWPVGFRNWFTSNRENGGRPLSETIKKCMSRQVRTAAGLGNPPVRYTNRNTSKFVSDAVAELESSDPIDLAKVHEVIKLKAVDSQITEFVKAMYNMGELRLAKEYQHLKVSLLS